MTRVCLLGDSDVNLQYELLSRETSREALSTYDLARPFENAIAVHTVSVGAAISLCNDLQWYVVRFVDEVLIQEPSVSEDEWLSRDLATAIRNDDLDPAESGEFLKIYGVERPAPERPTGPDGASAAVEGHADGPASATDDSPSRSEESTPTRDPEPSDDESDSQPSGPETAVGPPRLVEPLFVRRDGPGADGDDLPEYDLRDVEETLVVRISEDEYAP